MRNLVALGAVAALVAGCGGHQYEPAPPGVSLSGEAKAGVVYEEGQGTSTVSDSELKITLGASI
ncbi:hypothetical protein O2N63_05990 [Aliiroseovarius sp. KMU-50]|uniref:Argininosuccinate lyase n=1 Tax=Aliiroseovarius salicola TaxID=3009082 RepID=A0ABT4VZF7_9RHOB|nr:hypothetical protein [Aliiroseovarius sp. KMU-50]MDA5093638.1 hypothetical protein [Aliiroseovarius sp. KMU-50]